MSELSPAAQAVDTELAICIQLQGEIIRARPLAAAVLRAAADQVVPWQPEPTEDSVSPTVDFGYARALFSKANDVRQELLAIADELEAQ
jgi:hypothetical protein